MLRNSRIAHGARLADSLERARDVFPIYLFIFIVFLNRYVFGFYLTRLRGRGSTRRCPATSRRSTVVIPMFNEGPLDLPRRSRAWSSSDYPADKLEVIVVDDCSTDDSYELARAAARQYRGRRPGPAQPVQHGQALLASTAPCA